LPPTVSMQNPDIDIRHNNNGNNNGINGIVADSKLLSDFEIFLQNDKEPIEVMSGLYLGSQQAAKNRSSLVKSRITNVIIAAEEQIPYYPNEFSYKKLDLFDDEHENIINYFDDCIQYINAAIKKKGAVFVHCRVGSSRSASIVLAYMMHESHYKFDEALKKLKKLRPIVCPNDSFADQLKLFEKMNYSSQGNTKYHKLYRRTYRPFNDKRESSSSSDEESQEEQSSSESDTTVDTSISVDTDEEISTTSTETSEDDSEGNSTKKKQNNNQRKLINEENSEDEEEDVEDFNSVTLMPPPVL